ncbi:MAG: RNA-directed DNA polymerase [Verrucomicrobiales bacterium]|jgi:RNA-directed DNA polymerase
MKRHKHLWGKIVTFDNLSTAAREAMRGKRGKSAAARFFTSWEKDVVVLERELQEGTYLPGAYHYFYIHDPKTRQVAATPFRDRVVHHALVRVLEPLFERRFIEDSFACRKGKGTHAGMRRALQLAKRYRYALKCDIRRYFPPIDQGLLTGMISRVVGDQEALGLVDLILRTHVDRIDRVWPLGASLFDATEKRLGLPIGNLTSQFFANIYLDRFDHFVKQDLRVKGYLRYVDDFLLFSDDRAELKQLGRQCAAHLAEISLEIHPDKYRLLPTDKGVDFCGYVVCGDGRIKVRSSSVRRFQKRYLALCGQLERGRLDATELTRSVKAWIAHAEHAQSWGLRRDVLRA